MDLTNFRNIAVQDGYQSYTVSYALFYNMVLQPACVVGYVQEFLNRTKQWGTK